MFKKNFDKNSTSRNFDNFILLQSQTLEPSRQKIELELELQMGLMYESKKSLGLTGKIHQNFNRKNVNVSSLGESTSLDFIQFNP